MGTEERLFFHLGTLFFFLQIGGELPTVASLRGTRKMQRQFGIAARLGAERNCSLKGQGTLHWLQMQHRQDGTVGRQRPGCRCVCCVPAGCWPWCQPYLRCAAQIARWEGSHLPAGWAACVPGDRAWSFVRSSQREVFYREERVSFTAPVLRSSFRPLGSEMGLGRFQLSSETSKKIFLTLSQDQAGFKSQEEEG